MKTNNSSNNSSERHPRIALFRTLRVMVAAALLVALSIVCGKYLKISVGDTLRFSFENLPILLAGMAFGPLVGAAVGVAADLIGCVMVGYAINPILTVGAASIGLVGGLGYKLTAKAPIWLSVLASVVPAHLVGSLVIKTVGLWIYYGTPLSVLIPTRILNYAVVGALEYVVLHLLFRSRAVRSQLQKLTRP